jgi:hypothetical protein
VGERLCQYDLLYALLQRPSQGFLVC